MRERDWPLDQVESARRNGCRVFRFPASAYPVDGTISVKAATAEPWMNSNGGPVNRMPLEKAFLGDKGPTAGPRLNTSSGSLFNHGRPGAQSERNDARANIVKLSVKRSAAQPPRPMHGSSDPHPAVVIFVPCH